MRSGSSKSNASLRERSSQCRDRSGGFAKKLKKRWRVKSDATHSNLPSTVEHAGFLTSFDVGLYGRIFTHACLGGASVVQGHNVRRKHLVEEKACRKSARKVDVHVGGWPAPGCQGNRFSWAIEVVSDQKRPKEAGERTMGTKQPELFRAARTNTTPTWTESVSEEKSGQWTRTARRSWRWRRTFWCRGGVFLAREDLAEFGSTTSCLGCIPMLTETGATGGHGEMSKGVCGSYVEGDGPRRRQHKEARRNSRIERPRGEQNERSRVHGETQRRDGEAARTEKDTPATSPSKSNKGAAPAPNANDSGGTTRTDNSGERNVTRQCEDEEEVVELPREFQKCGKYVKNSTSTVHVPFPRRSSSQSAHFHCYGGPARTRPCFILPHNLGNWDAEAGGSPESVPATRCCFLRLL